MVIVLPSTAASTARRVAGFGHRRPATLLWLLLYAIVAVVAPSPASLAVTAALASVLVLRLRLAGLKPAGRAEAGHRE